MISPLSPLFMYIYRLPVQINKNTSNILFVTLIYYSLPDLTVDYYLFHCQSIPTVDVTVWRYHSNFLSSMVVAQGSNFVRLFARFCQQRLHVPKKMTGKFGVRFFTVRESKNRSQDKRRSPKRRGGQTSEWKFNLTYFKLSYRFLNACRGLICIFTS